MNFIDSNFSFRKWIVFSFGILLILNFLFVLFFKTYSPVNNYLELWRTLTIIAIVYVISFWVFFLPKFSKYLWIIIVLGWLAYPLYVSYTEGGIIDLVYGETGLVYIAGIITFILPTTLSAIYFGYVQKKSNKKLFIAGLILLSLIFLILSWEGAGENFAGFIVDIGTHPSKVDKNQCWKLLITLSNRDFYEDCKNMDFEEKLKDYNRLKELEILNGYQ